jgi:hypothetical protein
VKAISQEDQRLDLHNASIDFRAASAGQCGFTHLASGRICRLPHRHLGPCDPKHQPLQETRPFCNDQLGAVPSPDDTRRLFTNRHRHPREEP